MRHVIGSILLLSSISAVAQVYKWVDDKGVVHYTDQPPGKNAQPAALPPLQTYKGGTVPKLDQYARPADKGAIGPIKIKITSPAPDETFHNNAEGKVTVSVLVSPALEPGQQLVYYANGAAQGKPTSSSTQTLELERGSHNISVAVVENGKEISRSESVTIHLKQAVARKTPPPPPPPKKP